MPTISLQAKRNWKYFGLVAIALATTCLALLYPLFLENLKPLSLLDPSTGQFGATTPQDRIVLSESHVRLSLARELAHFAQALALIASALWIRAISRKQEVQPYSSPAPVRIADVIFPIALLAFSGLLIALSVLRLS